MSNRTKIQNAVARMASVAILGWVVHGAAGAQGAVAEVAAPPEPRFEIKGYAVRGNSLLTDQQVAEALAPHVSSQANFRTVQLALEALERAYVAQGYGSVRVLVPEQDIDGGTVRLEVLEARLGRVLVEGNRFFSESNVIRSLPALRTGEVVNMRALQRDTVLANDNSYKQATVVFRSGQGPAELDAVIRIQDSEPVRHALSLDNTGNDATGKWRLGLLYQNGNLWDADHAVAAQFVTSPGHFSDVHVVGLSYRIPLYGRGDSLDLTAAYSNVDSGNIATVGGNYALSGSGNVFGARYNHVLSGGAGGVDSRLIYSADFKQYKNSLTAEGDGQSLVPDFVVTPLGVAYRASSAQAERDWSAQVQALQNVVVHGQGGNAQFNLPGGRQGADASFFALKFDASYTHRFTNLSSIRASLSGQWTRDLLLAAEQFGAGGSDSVRGYGEREASGDRGWRAGLEWTGVHWGSDDVRVSPVVFVEWAELMRNRPLQGELARQSLGSVGVGLRGVVHRRLIVRMDAARTLKATAVTPKGHTKLHVQAIWIY